MCTLPNGDKADEEKDSIYHELDDMYGECPKRDCKIINGDMNAEVGKEQLYRPVIGKHWDETNKFCLFKCSLFCHMVRVHTHF
jgi:hypothetical protein